mmetsp:Transcript_29412/g.84172  ORF Transcript_29412/g.84172 Transcript_29412/m.84172 type:complete len:393 (-) Transcript_29412:137-1315(-)
MDPSHLRRLGLPLVDAFSSEDHHAACKASVPAADPARAAPPSEHLDLPRRSPAAEALASAMRRPLPLRQPLRQVSVVSFNMLLKAFDRKPYYPSVPPALRAWPGRKEQLEQLLASLDADIYCMQEVECSSFLEEFDFLARIGCDWVAPKDDSKGKMPGLAKCAIFYKAARLEKVWEEHRSRIVLAAFRHTATGRLLYVASCHLEGAPWEGEARFKQARNALESIQRHQKQCKVDPGACTLVFAGDFNETEDGVICHCLGTGGLGKDFRLPQMPDREFTKADYSHGFKLSDLYAADGRSFCQRPPTFCAPAEESSAWGMTPSFAAVDFMFYTHDTLRPAAVRLPFTEEQKTATEGCGIPSEWHGSDHVPIGGVFDLIAEGTNGSSSQPSPEVL